MLELWNIFSQKLRVVNSSNESNCLLIATSRSQMPKFLLGLLTAAPIIYFWKDKTKLLQLQCMYASLPKHQTTK